MTVNPGFGGQTFIPTGTAKVAAARELLDQAGTQGVEIQVDGGVDTTTAPELVAAGVTVLVAGSAVYDHPDGPTEGVRALRGSCSAP
jgi:ribulose-phosphate 3-epimerase